MVFINNTEEILFSDVCVTLAKKVSELSDGQNLDEVFAAWLLPEENLGIGLAAADESAKKRGAARTYQDVAILGFAIDSAPIKRETVEILKDGLNWLSGRSTSVNGMPTGASLDVVAILGIAIGASLSADNELIEQVKKWMSRFIYDTYNMRGIEEWQKCLLAAAQRALNITPHLALPTDDSVADVITALSGKKILRFDKPDDEVQKKTLAYLKSRKSVQVEPVRAALSLAAFNVILSQPISSSANKFTTEKQSQMRNETNKIKILFLGASPTDQDRLSLDTEVREIDAKLRLAANRDLFLLEQQWAVRVNDLQGLLLRYAPHIIHFSGHGSKANEIVLENNTGTSHPVSTKALGGLFAILKDNIRCVVLNACYSIAQAEAIAEHIDCVVGMSDAILDNSAISFAAAFYQALAYGKSVQDAFQLGCLQIDLENLVEGDIPRLYCHQGNADEIFFR